MRNIESKISPLIAGQFPSFYAEEGPNFIAFVKAYYEWLEQNFQLLDLESVTNFNVGDTVQQAEVTGTIYSVDSKSILVLVNGLDTFKCFNVCSELIPVTSSSGGSTYILRGGTTRRLGSLFMARNLGNIRDIDKTLDLFVVKFKEKYLKNIEFDTQTNKRLLVKNSLDLFRSKGTERSIDLFFRLIYGVKADVHYPGDDLFRLSDADWFKPKYIEINSTSVDRAITLVGKVITGVTSGATAFVERYVKKKVNSGFVHVFLVSNVKGTFEVNEVLKYNQLYKDSPKVIGSFTGAVVLDGSESFAVGDLINFQSELGLGGIGRVTDTQKGSGEVSFKINDGGWGFTVNRDTTVTGYTANTFLSDKYIVLANVQPGQLVANVGVTLSGLGYNNSDIITISSFYRSAKARPITDSNGSIISCVVTNRGAGFNPTVDVPDIIVSNSSGFSSNGVGGQFVVDYEYPKRYFEYGDRVTQQLFNITYSGASNEDSFEAGQYISVGGVPAGILTAVDKTADTMTVNLFKNGNLPAGAQISVTSNNTIYATVSAVANTIANGEIIFISNTGLLELGVQRGSFALGDVLYQRDEKTNEYVAQATITRTSELSLAGGFVNVSNLTGVFRPGANVFILDKPTDATFAELKTISLSIAVANTNNTAFSDVFSPILYSTAYGTTALTSSLSSGAGARYRIGTIADSDIVTVNTDRLSNNTLLNTRLNATAFGFPADASANSQSVLYGALSYTQMTIGSIETLDNINPGVGYNRNPIASVFQPFVTSYQAYDYVFDITDPSGSFVRDELVTQTRYDNRVRIFVSNTVPYKLGERVYVANTTVNTIANGTIVAIENAGNSIDVRNVQGVFPTTNTYLVMSLFSAANSYITNAVPFVASYTAKGRVKSFTNDKVFVKRIQLENNFETGNTFVGSLSGSSARLVGISDDVSSQVAGFNAIIDTNASTANGVISQVQIIDSGYGFSNDDTLEFSVVGDERTGSVQIIKGGVGTGTGYYRTAKGFVSDISKIHDGDYYQEYSYDIISRIPIDKYSSMFKKVMHTAGTRFFGSVLIDSLIDTKINVATTTQDVGAQSPYNIQDRGNIDVQDRDRIYIEIRE